MQLTPTKINSLPRLIKEAVGLHPGKTYISSREEWANHLRGQLCFLSDKSNTIAQKMSQGNVPSHEFRRMRGQLESLGRKADDIRRQLIALETMPRQFIHLDELDIPVIAETLKSVTDEQGNLLPIPPKWEATRNIEEESIGVFVEAFGGLVEAVTAKPPTIQPDWVCWSLANIIHLMLPGAASPICGAQAGQPGTYSATGEPFGWQKTGWGLKLTCEACEKLGNVERGQVNFDPQKINQNAIVNQESQPEPLAQKLDRTIKESLACADLDGLTAKHAEIVTLCAEATTSLSRMKVGSQEAFFLDSVLCYTHRALREISKQIEALRQPTESIPVPKRMRIGTSELAHLVIPGEKVAVCGSKPAPNSRGWFDYPEGGRDCGGCYGHRSAS
jgi:hypothetical protein